MDVYLGQWEFHRHIFHPVDQFLGRGQGFGVDGIRHGKNVFQILLFRPKAIPIGGENGGDLLRAGLDAPNLIHRKASSAQSGNVKKLLNVFLGIGAVLSSVLAAFFWG